MAKNKNISSSAVSSSVNIFQTILSYWLGALGLLIALSFFLYTQDSAQVKITLLHAGAWGAFGIWVCGLCCVRAPLLAAGKKLLPFIVYFLYLLCSYLFAPHFWGRFSGFIYFISCSLIFLCAATLDGRGLRVILRFVIWAAWAAFGYGALQIIHNFIWPGADIFYWSGAFGRRVFSTFANPNFFADFCAFALLIIAAAYLQTRRKSLLILAALGALNIVFSESKGAWLALAVGGVIFAGGYINFFTDIYQKHKTKIFAFMLGALLLAGALAAHFTFKRERSLTFRLHTWAAAAQMIADKPTFGPGAGSFFIEYPAYKHPQIFYIEGTHNIQTAHAENHYLEILATQGVAGGALFAWCALYLLFGVWRKLKREKDFTLLACAGALVVIYAHNFVDISLYFASTGYFAALFAGGVLALVRGPLLPGAPAAARKKPGVMFNIFAFLALFVFTALAVLIVKDFAFMASGLWAGKKIMCAVSWVFLAAALAGVVYAFGKTIFAAGRVLPCLVLLMACGPMFYAWQLMRAGNFTAAATANALAGDSQSAFIYYDKAIKIAPFEASLYHFRGLMRAAVGDYRRSQEDYDSALKLNPREPLLYYNLGAMQLAAGRYRDAHANLLLALELDPVYDNIYFQLFNAQMRLGNPREAYEWLQKYTRGPAGVSDPAHLAIHQNNPTANKYLQEAGLK